MFNFNNRAVQWTVLLFLSFIWGSSFILMKKGLEVFSDTQVAALRIVITFICLLPFALKTIRKFPKKVIVLLFLSSTLGSGIPAFMFTKAETGISSSLTGILNSLTPLFTLITGALFFKLRARWYNVAGIILGLLGTVLLLSSNGSGDFGKNLSFGVFVIIATLCYAFNTNFIKNRFSKIDAVSITSIGFLFIGPIALTYLLTTDFTIVLQNNNQAFAGLGYIAILAILGTAMSVVLYNHLLKHSTAIFTSSVTYVIPIFALMWGIADGESLSLIDILFISVILIGIYLVNLSVKKKNVVE